jgi:hypothetical protein
MAELLWFDGMGRTPAQVHPAIKGPAQLIPGASFPVDGDAVLQVSTGTMWTTVGQESRHPNSRRLDARVNRGPCSRAVARAACAWSRASW